MNKKHWVAVFFFSCFLVLDLHLPEQSALLLGAEKQKVFSALENTFNLNIRYLALSHELRQGMGRKIKKGLVSPLFYFCLHHVEWVYRNNTHGLILFPQLFYACTISSKQERAPPASSIFC
ncbi:MAG: hypothetical protein HY958_14325 [Bacteroidia bacterium]|nr:hypothetical protein [Bacteroidia bacterium]